MGRYYHSVDDIITACNRYNLSRDITSNHGITCTLDFSFEVLQLQNEFRHPFLCPVVISLSRVHFHKIKKKRSSAYLKRYLIFKILVALSLLSQCFYNWQEVAFKHGDYNSVINMGINKLVSE